MGALHDGHVALDPRGARGERHRRREPLRQPGAVRRGRRPRARTRATRSATLAVAERDGRRRPLRAVGRGDVPAGLSDVGRRERARRAGSRATLRPGPLPRRRDGLPEALQHRPAAIAPTSARRTRSRWRSSGSMVRDLDLEVEIRVVADRPRRRRPRALVAERPPLGRRARARARSPPRARDPRSATPRARAARRRLDVDYVEVADFDPPVLAAAVRVGSTRLIDNVVLRRRHRMSTRPQQARPGTPAPGKLAAHRARRR